MCCDANFDWNCIHAWPLNDMISISDGTKEGKQNAVKIHLNADSLVVMCGGGIILHIL